MVQSLLHLMAMIVWLLDLQLPMQSVPIITDVVSSNLDQGEVFNNMWLSLLMTGRWFSSVSSTNKTDSHNITEILLKVVLNTVKPTNQTLFIVGYSKLITLWLLPTQHLCVNWQRNLSSRAIVLKHFRTKKMWPYKTDDLLKEVQFIWKYLWQDKKKVTF